MFSHDSNCNIQLRGHKTIHTYIAEVESSTHQRNNEISRDEMGPRQKGNKREPAPLKCVSMARFRLQTTHAFNQEPREKHELRKRSTAIFSKQVARKTSLLGNISFVARFLKLLKTCAEHIQRRPPLSVFTEIEALSAARDRFQPTRHHTLVLPILPALS